MYLEFYGLRESPFNLTPDTNFLFPSRVHREVLTHLLYGVTSRKGFIMVTGEIGSGKTTLCRALLARVGPNTEVALVLNSFLSELELLQTINEDLGIKSTGSSKKQLIDELNAFLLEERMKGKNVVLIIDEAQNLSFPVLEQIRMLSNLETEKEKLLQIVLVGQPELRRLLGSPRLRQLNQRITVRHHIIALTGKETTQYIYHRLRVAGSSGNIVFTNSALKEIYRFSGGIPRMINVVCDQALLGGYVASSRRIDRKIVRAAESEIEGVGKQPRGLLGREFSLLRVGAGVGMVLAACLIAVAALGPSTIADWGSRIVESGMRSRKSEIRNRRVASVAGGRTREGPVRPSQMPPHASEGAPEPASPGGKAVASLDGGKKPEGPVRDIATSPPPRSLMPLAFLSGGASRLGQTLPRVLSSEMEPLFYQKAATLTTLPPGPKVRLPKSLPVPTMLDRRVVAYRSFVEPMFSLLRLWKRPPETVRAVRERYAEVGGHFPSLAEAAKMGWVSLRADLETLRTINMPAIVGIKSETDEQKGYVALVATGETWVEVITAEGRKRLDVRLFSEIFAGAAILLTQDTFVDPSPLRQGQGISLRVRKLQDYMRGAGYFRAPSSGWFAQETTAAVMAFQRDHGLPVSGEADGRTKLLLYASQGAPGVPHLRASE